MAICATVPYGMSFALNSRSKRLAAANILTRGLDFFLFYKLL